MDFSKVMKKGLPIVGAIGMATLGGTYTKGANMIGRTAAKIMMGAYGVVAGWAVAEYIDNYVDLDIEMPEKVKKVAIDIKENIKSDKKEDEEQ